jgi:protein involved in polysaccharide export with SLBB domain
MRLFHWPVTSLLICIQDGLGKPRWFGAIILTAIVACSPNSQMSAQSRTEKERSGYSLLPENGMSSGYAQSTDSGRFQSLWVQRTNDSFSPDFALGPGDLLRISVPDMDELKDRLARISASGTIELPIVGVINVAGLSEDQVRVLLEQRLSRFMRDPDVDLNVTQFRSREVAVVGMVQKPGLYTLSTRSDTILDMISRAGGMSADASPHVIFIPAPKGGAPALTGQLLVSPTTNSQEPGSASAGSTSAVLRSSSLTTSAEHPEQPSERKRIGTSRIPFAADSVLGFSKGVLPDANPIEIDLTSAAKSKQFIDLPARPGDVIIVPAIGEVMVQGWVANPGAFRITPGMTALGAVTAAGGEQFSSSATVLRTNQDADKIQIAINLASIKAGKESDVAIQSGDVIVVNRSVVGAVPYFIYTLFSRFGTGAYVPLPTL